MSEGEHVFQRSVRIARPAAEVFAWHERPGAFARLAPPWQKVVVESESGGIRDGARVVLRTYLGPIGQRWEVVHRDYEAGRQFRDVMVDGPFAAWDHLHRMEPDGEGACVLTDTIRFRLPGGAAGNVGLGVVERMLARVFAYRHRVTKADLESKNTWSAGAAPRRVLVSGASGLVGTGLTARLTTAGWDVVKLVRREARESDELAWDPAEGRLDLNGQARFDAVVNLSGANIAGGRWTDARKKLILESRIQSVGTLAKAILALPEPERPGVVVSASAVGWYGDTGARTASEGDASGSGFLAEVCRQWEGAWEPVRAAGVRCVAVRTGVVLTPAGGALALMLPAFRLGVGGPLGNGRQGMSWISAEDLTEIYLRSLTDESLVGPVNATAPEIVTSKEFARGLGRVLHRPAIIPVPALVLRAALGQLADEALLASSRVEPAMLRRNDFDFRHPSLEKALRAVLGRGIET